MGNEVEATVSNIVGSASQSVFITQPAKAVTSPFKSLLTDAHVLLSGNDAYETIGAFAGQNEDGVVSVLTDDATVFSNLPFLSSEVVKKSKIVSHVEIQSQDFRFVTALRDLNLPVIITQNIEETSVWSSVAYNMAAKLHQPVFHFYVSSAADSRLKVPKQQKKVLIDNVDDYRLGDILKYFDVKPFHTLSSANTASDSIVFLGEVSDALVKAFKKADVFALSISLYKPFDLHALLSSIPASVETITFIQQTDLPAAPFSPLLLDFFQDYSSYQSLKNFTKVVSAFFGQIDSQDFEEVSKKIVNNAHRDAPEQNVYYGLQGSRTQASRSIQLRQDRANAAQKAFSLEQAYFKLLQQASQASNLNILNEFNNNNIGLQTNPEYGFGYYLYYEEKQKELVSLVNASIQGNLFKSIDNNKLIHNLTQWLVSLKENSVLSKDVIGEIVDLLTSDSQTESTQELLKLKEFFEVKSHWLVGSDAWSYDLGSSGVHSLVTSGKNLNMLIIDSEPYKEKKNTKEINGQRKKDVGLYAMNYGGCYVASVAVYSSYTQTLQAFIEAEKFNGPSIVIAYLPYDYETDDTLTVLKETKAAVDTGYWPLYRFNPEIDEEQSFKLDSSVLKNKLREFLDRNNKLSMLAKKDPELSRNLVNNASTPVKQRQTEVANESFNKLLQGLSGPPLTVAFASDNGNAESLAKKINRQAVGRGLKSIILAMDDLSIEDLPNETNIVFVTSTSGQGEFPTNGKQFWDALKNANDLDLSSIKFSVFGLGDSEYWPRKEDKHYYNKPGKDLFAKLKLYGAVEFADLGLGDDQDADGFNTGFNEWIPNIWKALGVDNVEGVEEPKPLTNEDMKIQSNYLRGTIVEGLADQSTGSISAVDQQLTKFHGIYMQDDRDVREERKSEGLEPAYAFMVRVRLPGGIATPKQYLRMNELADERGNGTLKLTTRATFQLHGVVKHDLKPAIRGMNAALMDTLAACGDVNRNVMVSALPHRAKVHEQISKLGGSISEHLLPTTTAYHEIWLEGNDEGDKAAYAKAWENRKEGPQKKKTMVAGNALEDHEPLYGPTYLPRKFKIVITVPPFNDVDVYAHDIGLIAIVEDDEVLGFNVLAGGGMGSTHNNKKTYPRAGSMLGYVSKDQIKTVCEKIMIVQRDNGDRTNRKHARLKYTIDDMGVDVFKGKVEDLLDFKFEEPRPFEIKSNLDYFGWCKDEFGLNHFTAFIENGRVEDTPELPQKTGLKKIAEYLIDHKKSGEFRLTGNQHLLISKIEDEDLPAVKSLMAEYKLDNTNFSGLRLSSAACVAFPTCGLAMAESERYLPELVSKLEVALEDYGLRHDSIVMRMTGCPNGCARPWLAEVALVGKAYGAYNLMLGGGYHGERVNKIYRYSIKEDEILATLKPLFKRWSLERNEGEHFGDFCVRVGIIKPTLEGKFFHDDIPEDA
ncbi:Piso0_002569 [Millerozyma farinosa CBS 7064]|uniref:Sulfite reductase [NADPH] subunit beta n=1 Tax=Pichia sorbitophila (strain ATCC MYA-4447 / BCRC 22081 / CBS 7064 / NBRC 10061 / NRRL Y-12695) TaxID=559304 RepID=G8YCY8_PICSO|nr:Piso0_002569 [Millerozyma farinosa CBS 7064]